jgi:phosphatidylglycerophosphatase A
MNYHKAIASVFGIGYIPKGGGTVTALFTCLLIICYQLYFDFTNKFYQLLLFDLAIFITVLGKISTKVVEPIWGKDSPKIVIDEVAGMLVTLCFLPYSMTNIVLGFMLFRFFDIYKPLYIRHFEKYPQGWGVMLDDVAAGIWANCTLQMIRYLNFF